MINVRLFYNPIFINLKYLIFMFNLFFTKLANTFLIKNGWYDVHLTNYCFLIKLKSANLILKSVRNPVNLFCFQFYVILFRGSIFFFCLKNNFDDTQKYKNTA